MLKKLLVCAAVFVVVVLVAILFFDKDHLPIFSSKPDIEKGIDVIDRSFPYQIDLRFMSASKENMLFESATAYFTVNMSKETVDTYRAKIDRYAVEGAPINLDRAIDTAKSYVEEYRPEFKLSEMQMTTAELRDFGDSKRYVIEWRLYRNGVDICHYISMELRMDGELASFDASENVEFNPDIKQVISMDEAVTIAKKYLEKTQPESITCNMKMKDALLIGRSNRAIVWRVTFTNGSEITSSSVVNIDAHNGKIVNSAQS